MKHTFIYRFTVASLFILALSIFGASASFGALNAYLKLQGKTNGKSYKVTPDANGKFSFQKVEVGSYQLQLVASDEYFAAKQKDKDAHKDEIQLMSFSWGASNSIVSNSGNADRESSAPSVSEIVVKKSTDKSSPGVASGDLNGNGTADLAAPQKIREAKGVSLQNPMQAGSKYYVIILDNVMVSSVCSPSGTISGFAINQPGVK